MPLLGVDTGGTFTDFVLFAQPGGQQNNISVHKVLSTPKAPEQAILRGIHELGLTDNKELFVVHGSTVATNAVLEGKGVRTVFITNFGLRDLLTIGRQARRELYNLNPKKIAPPVPPELCLETGGRLAADGGVIEPLTEEHLLSLRKEIEKLAPESVAINLLFSWLDDSFEKQIASVIPGNIFVSRSSGVLPEIREYERGITTWLNASVGPLVKSYLNRLCGDIPHASVSVMQSAGGTIEAGQAGEQAVHMLLSGPAGGMAGVQYVGMQAGEKHILSFDMGGTSTDVALVECNVPGQFHLTTEGKIGPYPVGIPMVDMHTIGAGGGSIAYVDEGGLLQVGPESAGADPGPACYGKGGSAPTVSDANLVLGRLRSNAFLGGGMSLDVLAARKAVASIADVLGLSVEDAAKGIIDVANEHMSRALRVMSVQRAINPADLTLACFGGAGGLHVCALAESLGITKALVPIHAGVLSALGMLVAPRARYLSLTMNKVLVDIGDDGLQREVQQEIDRLAAQGIAGLVKEGINTDSIVIIPSVDVRYRGQSYTINIDWEGTGKTIEAFHEQHEKLYGHSIDQAIELVTLRVKIQGPGPQIENLYSSETKPAGELETARLPGIYEPVTIYPRGSLEKMQTINGPCLVTETVSTTFIAPGWKCELHSSGSLKLTRIND
ncbi:hydantoinase/oxoprolinase family protein [Kaarinaea lacus]